VLVVPRGYHYRYIVSEKNRSERGVATVEYGITIGAVALVAAAMFAQCSDGVAGIWRQATAASGRASAATSISYTECMANAHGDSKVCSNIHF
jgi:Flp pilus assembly pilin Flp